MGKRVLIAALTVAALVVLGQAVFWSIFEAPEQLNAPPVPTPAPPSAAEADAGPVKQVNVLSITGQVTRKGDDATWVPVKQGDELTRNVAIRTADDATAVLAIGDTATATIHEQSVFSVDEITRRVAKVRMERGRMDAVVHGTDGSKLQVGTRDSDAIAEASKGEFSMLANGKGDFVVASRKGRVTVSAKNKSVEVLPGKRTVVRRGAAPSESVAIPKSLLLKVKAPVTREQREKSLRVSGRTNPGALVSVNKLEPIQADSKGNFSTVVSLRTGSNRIAVVARDVSGRIQHQELGSVTVKTRVAPAKSKVDWNRK